METLANQNCHPYNDGHLYVDLRHELVMLDSQVVPLTHKEYCLLLLLVQHAGEVVTRKTVEMRVWGHVLRAQSSTVEVHIRRLRKKLGIYGKKRIEVVLGFGYYFRPAFRHYDNGRTCSC